MANRGDVISVDKLWDVFDREREKAWDGENGYARYAGGSLENG